MRYISIDVETTGLDPLKHQVIELGMVDSQTQETFWCYIDNPRIETDPYCAQLHYEIWSALAKKKQAACPIYTIPQLQEAVAAWLDKIGYMGRIIPAGKNFAGFDKLFIQNLQLPMTFTHRVLDPGSMYATDVDHVPPDLTECVRRAGCKPLELHRALDDALMVHHCIQAFFTKGKA